MTQTLKSDITALLADVEQHITNATGEITLMLFGPNDCGHGPNVAGQLAVDIWNPAEEEADQYVLDLHRDPAVDPDDQLDAVRRTFLEWLKTHGISPKYLDPPWDGEQLCVSVSFRPQDWKG